MTRCGGSRSRLATVAFAAMALVNGASGADILQTVGFSKCGTNADVSVQKVDITYNASNKTVSFDVAGTSNKIQNVTAVLNVTAYGVQAYSNSFNPCSPGTFVSQLCPVPAGTFSARGQQVIPAQFADAVPAIAFQVPDIAAMATLQLKSLDTGKNVACIQSQVTNGKTSNIPAVSYVAAGVAGAALVLTGVSAIGAAVAGGSGAAAGSSAAGVGTISPTFTEVFGWFQGMAMNGMMSVAYPQVYRSFSKNFAFSTGLIPWTSMQMSIDDFRSKTGGNVTADGVQFLRNATLVFPDGSISTAEGSAFRIKRAFDDIVLLATRQIETNVNNTTPAASGGEAAAQPDTVQQAVTGIQAYAQQLAIPSANTFMTVLLVVAIVIAAIVVGILLVKVILEGWALFASFPQSLTGFRKHYWGSIGRAITSLILVLYGIWVLYCIFQFTHGDSWAAKTLAGVTLAIFTGILAFFSFRIWHTAQKLKKLEGDAAGLYMNKKNWVRYSIFYDAYKRDYWWLFVPTIVYMFAKGVCLAVGDGHGMAQSISMLVIEGVMLILLLWSRPYERKSGNVINVAIQVVRVLSVGCILIFVQEFGIAQTTQTVAGVVLIAVQSALTGILAILIAWNAISACCKANPHRQRRKELEKMRDMDNLTPLDARNSLLMDRPKTGGVESGTTTFSMANTVGGQDSKTMARDSSPGRYSPEPANPYSSYTDKMAPAPGGDTFRPLTPNTPLQPADESRANLLGSAAPIGRGPSPGPYQPPSSGPWRPPTSNSNYGSKPSYSAGYAGPGGYSNNGGYNYSRGGY